MVTCFASGKEWTFVNGNLVEPYTIDNDIDLIDRKGPKITSLLPKLVLGPSWILK